MRNLHAGFSMKFHELLHGGRPAGRPVMARVCDEEPTVLRMAQGDEPLYDVLIVGGRVIDPGTNFDGIADVAVKNSRIAAVGTDLCHDDAREIFDATGLLVTPGLVDTHVHVYDSMIPLGIDADRHCLGRGCTTVVDAGSAGCNTLPGLKRFAVAQQKCRILAFMHVSSHGLANVPIYQGIGELDSLDYIDAELALHTLQKEKMEADSTGERSIVVGVKIRLSDQVTDGVREVELEAYRTAQKLAADAQLPLMVHHNWSSIPLEQSPGLSQVPAATAIADVCICHCRRVATTENQTLVLAIAIYYCRQ